MKAKKIPMRKCLGCQESFPKRDLYRIVRNKENEVIFDPTGKANGRGAYICKNVECYKKSLKTGRLKKALETQIPENIYIELSKELKIDE